MTSLTRALALLAAALAAPAFAQTAPVDAVALDGARIDAVIAASGLSGDVSVARSDAAGFAGYAHVAEGADASAVWRWASVTKQVVAVLVLRQVEAGRIDLDQPIARYLPEFRSPNAATATVRQLLRHQAGLPNPDDRAASQEAPAYYTADAATRDPLNGFCAGPVKGPPGGAWDYNNCDYIVAGALLEAVTGKAWRQLVQEDIATPLRLASVASYPTDQPLHSATVDGAAEPAMAVASYEASGALVGTPDDLVRFDLALMDGRLLTASSLAQLWDGQADLGYIALGQWVFTVPLAGCAEPQRIVERRGSIGGVEVRNFMLPDRHIAVVAFSDRAPFDFGEVLQGSGFSHDLLSAAACPAATTP